MSVQGNPNASENVRRATLFWWFTFCGPILVALGTLAAGVIGEGESAIAAFFLGVFTYALTVILSSTPGRMAPTLVLYALAISLIGAALGSGLLLGVQRIGELSTTTTTATSMPPPCEASDHGPRCFPPSPDT